MKSKVLFAIGVLSIFMLPSTGHGMYFYRLLTGKKNVVEHVTPVQNINQANNQKDGVTPLKEKSDNYSAITNAVLGMCARQCQRSLEGEIYKNCASSSGLVKADGITFFYNMIQKGDDQQVRSFKWTIFERYQDLINPDNENALPAKKGTLAYNVATERNKHPESGFVRLDEGTRCDCIERVGNEKDGYGQTGYMNCETVVSEELFQQFMQKENK